MFSRGRSRGFSGRSRGFSGRSRGFSGRSGGHRRVRRLRSYRVGRGGVRL